MGSDRIGTKLHEPDDKELKYFQLFWSGCADHTRWKSVQSDAYFPEWKPALRTILISPAVLRQEDTSNKASFSLIAKANSQARCEHFDPIPTFESTRCELASWLLR